MAASIWVGVDDAARIGRFADGSAAAPSITFASDTDTGLYRVDSNTLGFTTAGNEAFRVTRPSAGSVSTLASPASYINFTAAGAFQGGFGNAAFTLPSSGSIQWGILGGATDLILTRDAANTLAQRNGTNAQAFRVYNTYTDASNYERAAVSFAADVLSIGFEGAGTGNVQREVRLVSAGTTFLTLTTGAKVSISRDLILGSLGTVDPGVAGQLWNDAGTVKVSAG